MLPIYKQLILDSFVTGSIMEIACLFNNKDLVGVVVAKFLGSRSLLSLSLCSKRLLEILNVTVAFLWKNMSVNRVELCKLSRQELLDSFVSYNTDAELRRRKIWLSVFCSDSVAFEFFDKFAHNVCPECDTNLEGLSKDLPRLPLFAVERERFVTGKWMISIPVILGVFSMLRRDYRYSYCDLILVGALLSNLNEREAFAAFVWFKNSAIFASFRLPAGCNVVKEMMRVSTCSEEWRDLICCSVSIMCSSLFLLRLQARDAVKVLDCIAQHGMVYLKHLGNGAVNMLPRSLIFSSDFMEADTLIAFADVEMKK
jgi:hypothetical protein